MQDKNMNERHVESLAAEVVARLEGAKRELAARMQAMGMTAATGWRVTEELRHTVAGTEWIFRPVHLREPSPDVEVRVAIDHGGRPL
jgi:roadblock/LC7 domain-containing protein